MRRIQYNGDFFMRWLRADEQVSAVPGDDSGACLVWRGDVATRINVGDWIVTRAGKLHRIEAGKE